MNDGFYQNLSPRSVTIWHKENRTNKTGFIGVKYSTKNKRFEAYIKVHGRSQKMYCGGGKTADEAARKYDAASRKLYGPTAVTNFTEIS